MCETLGPDCDISQLAAATLAGLTATYVLAVPMGLLFALIVRRFMVVPLVAFAGIVAAWIVLFAMLFTGLQYIESMTLIAAALLSLSITTGVLALTAGMVKSYIESRLKRIQDPNQFSVFDEPVRKRPSKRN